MSGVLLVTARLPGVTTPVPLEKTAVRAEELPAVTVAGLAAKPAMEGAAGGGPLLMELPQPSRPHSMSARLSNRMVRPRVFFMASFPDSMIETAQT